MNTASQGAGPKAVNRAADQAKLVVAILLVVAGVAGFYVLSDSPTVVRLLSLIAGFVAGGAVAWFSEPGRNFLNFARESYVETKKVVWPTRKESLQTAGAVFAFVILMALFLWISDKTLEYVFYDVILGWKR